MDLRNHKLSKLLIYLNLLLLLTLPQLYNVHYEPLPQFLAEALFAKLSLSLFVLTCAIFPTLSIPKIIIPILLFASFISIQQYFVHIDFISLSYVASLELIICGLLAISISTLCTAYGITVVLGWIATSLLVGATFQSLIGFSQHMNFSHYINKLGNIIFYDQNRQNNIFGHFGQRNHYCHYLSLAILSLVYLWQRSKITTLSFISLSSWFIFSITISGSRAVFIYFILACAICVMYYIKSRNSNSLKLLITMTAVCLFVLCFEYMLPLIEHGQVSATQRMFSPNTNGTSSITGFLARIIEWKKAWIVFTTHPIVGCGFNQFAKHSVNLQPLFPLHGDGSDVDSQLYTNCHNLIMQLLAETGIIGALIVGVGIITAIYSINKSLNVSSTIVIAMLLITITHSMLEYPLWYLYFLGPFIMTLSVNKASLAKISSNTLAGISIAPIIYIFYQLITGNNIITRLTEYFEPPHESKSFIMQTNYLKNLANSNSLWEFPAIYTLSNYLNIDNTNTNSAFTLSEQLYYIHKFSDFRPFPDLQVKIAILNWQITKQKQISQNLIALTLKEFPGAKLKILGMLNDLGYNLLIPVAK